MSSSYHLPCNLTLIQVPKDLGDLHSYSHSVLYLLIHSTLLLDAHYVSGPEAAIVQNRTKLGITPALRSEWSSGWQWL